MRARRADAAVGLPTPDVQVGASGLNGIFMAYVYILKSDSGRYYIGSTLNLSARLRHHRNGFTPSTKKLGQMSLVLKQEYLTLQEARFIETKLKRLKRKDYIEKIVRDGIIKMGV